MYKGSARDGLYPARPPVLNGGPRTKESYKDYRQDYNEDENRGVWHSGNHTNGWGRQGQVYGGPDSDQRHLDKVDSGHQGRDNGADPGDTASLDSTGKQKSFRRLVVRFAEKTSMQGIPYIRMAKFWYARLFWVILTLGAVGVMIFHLYYLVAQYRLWPVSTTITLGFANLAFPAITICNVNPMRQNRLRLLENATEFKALIDALHPDKLAPQDPTAGQNRRKRVVNNLNQLDLTQFKPDYQREEEEEEDFLDDELDSAVDRVSEIEEVFQELYMDLSKEERQEAGHQIEDMLLSCSFSGRVCEPDNFTLYQSSEYGNCWTLDNPKFVSKTAGPWGGLNLVLYTETREYLDGISNGYGLRLVIHDPGTLPFPTEEGHYVPAAMETSIALKMVNIQRESHPYGDCEAGTQFRRSYGLKYSRQACQIFCELSEVLRECECYDDESEQLVVNLKRKSKLCRTRNETLCRDKVQRQFDRKQRQCPTCSNPCSETKYERVVSNRQWPTDTYANVLLQSVCEGTPSACSLLQGNMNDKRNLNYNFLKVNIYYEDLNFESIGESPAIEDAQFYSDVGGAIGLWIGLSILSMCEIIQLIAECFAYGFHRFRHGGRQRTKRKNKHKKHKHEKHSTDDKPNSREGANTNWPNTAFAPSLTANTFSSRDGDHYDRVRDGDKHSRYYPQLEYGDFERPRI